MKSPIFLFSLPRSGSTLLQRILMGHKNISSVAEPWLLLPFLYANQKKGILTEYSQGTAYIAFEDFINSLPNKREDYYEELNKFVISLYEKQCKNNEVYFIDKTPRYYFIIPEIAKIFPNAKFIFLFRNLVHVFSSIIETWGNGYLKGLYNYTHDLTTGPKALSEGYLLLKNRSYNLQYEKFISQPEKYLIEICNYLDINFDIKMLKNFSSQNTNGRMGDQIGIKKYGQISTASLNKWKDIINTSFRKKIILKFLNNLSDDIFNIQGYNKKNIISEVNELKALRKYLIKDRFDYLYSQLIQFTKPNIYLGNSTKKWARNRFLS